MDLLQHLSSDHELLPEKAEELFKIPVIGTIPFDENIMDSTAEGVPILWYNTKSKSCNSFLNIAMEIAGIEHEPVEEPEMEEEMIMPIVEIFVPGVAWEEIVIGVFRVGHFIGVLITFEIVALVIFLIVKLSTRMGLDV